MNRAKIYFPALDGLRFIAFLLVFLHHVTFYLSPELANNFFWKYFRNNGWVGVDIFFVLTGFLITYLLLIERGNQQKFSLFNFLKRRIFRIFPLYYFSIFLYFFIAPWIYQNSSPRFFTNINYDSLIWHLFFLGNWHISFHGYGDLRGISQLWAISLDFQFYLSWPIILLFLKNFRASLITTLILISLAVSTRIYLKILGVDHPGIYVNTFARLDTFLFGALLGFTYFYKPEITEKLKKFITLPFQIFYILFFITYLYFANSNNIFYIRNGIVGYLITGFLSTLIILFLIKTNSYFTNILNSKILIYLGKLGFGLYIFHIFSLEIYCYLFNLSNYLLPPLSLTTTILLAVIFNQLFKLFRFVK